MISDVNLKVSRGFLEGRWIVYYMNFVAKLQEDCTHEKMSHVIAFFYDVWQILVNFLILSLQNSSDFLKQRAAPGDARVKRIYIYTIYISESPMQY